MVAAISRLTTEYVDTEDRLRLSGEIANAAPVAMWLTQRLALRLIPALLRWLDGQAGAASAENSAVAPSSTGEMQKEVVHGFAQEAAVAELKAHQRVQAAASDGWLVQSIDLAPTGQQIALIFRAADGRAAGLGMTAQELRQWLAIVHAAWIRAEWPSALWPDWMRREAKPSGQQIVLH
jgi:hypothetical protein